jgi:glutaryl-CoA dehydrogenase
VLANNPKRGEKDVAFEWADPFQLEGQLSEQERATRDVAREYAQSKLAGRVKDDFRHEVVGIEVFREMGELGFLGSMVPRTDGTVGMTFVEFGLVAREIERVDSGYRTMLAVQSALVMLPIHAYGSAVLRQRYLPKLRSGDWVGCFGLSEPEFGSDAGGMRSRARPVQGGHLLSGVKAWISHAPIADVFVIWAKVQCNEKDEIRGFVVEKEWAGLSTEPVSGKIGLRTCVSGSVHLDEVFVPDENLLSAKGLRDVFSCLNAARYGIAWGALGAAEDCWHRALTYTVRRQQFGRPLAANQLVQKKLADMQTEIAIGLQAVLRLGRLRDEGDEAIELTSLLKRNSCGKALSVAREARDMLGGNGILDQFGVARHLVNLEAVNTYEGTNDIHALVLGRAQTGLAAFN